MKNRDLNIESYLEQITGEKIQIKQVDNDKLSGIALYLKYGFKFFRTKLFDHDVVLAKPVSDIEINPGRSNQYLTILGRKFKLPVILILDNLVSFQRSRFIQRRIPFIIPGQQIYIPKLLVDLKVKVHAKEKPLSSFTASTQHILFYHLLVESLNDMYQKEIAKLLQYSPMTISRAKKELKKAEVLISNNKICFINDKQEIWNKCRAYLRSPIRDVVYENGFERNNLYYRTGINALAHYTDISGNETNSYAVYYKSYQSKKNSGIEKYQEFTTRTRIEIWDYQPGRISKNAIVDPLSLYMSMINDDNDERTEIALDQLLKQVI